MELSSSDSSSTSWSLPVWAELLLLIGLPLLIYASSFSYGLMGLDDDLYYLHYPALHGGAWPGPVDVWKQPYASEYFPVTATTLWVDLAVFGSENWTGARVHQILWFVAGVLGVWALVRRVTNRRDFAFWAALFYAVHPVCNESVLWLAQRKNLVAQAFVLWSVERYIAMRQAESARDAWKRGIVSGLLCACAILSKTQGVCVPAVLFVYEACMGRGTWPKRLMAWAPFALSSAVFILLYPIFISEALVGPMLGGSRVAAIANTGWIVTTYLQHTVAPSGLSFYYATGEYSAASLTGWLGCVIVAAILAGAIYVAQERKIAAFFWLGGFAALAPALNLVRQPIPMTDHYHHWALWGWVPGLILTLYGVALRIKGMKYNLVPVVAGMLAVLFGILTFARVPDFRSLFNVLAVAVKNEPNSAWGQASLVAELVKEKDPQIRAQAGPHALQVFQCADAPLINPLDRGTAVREAAYFLTLTGKKPEALALIEKESEAITPPVLRDVYKAELFLRLGDAGAAVRLLEPEFKNRFEGTSDAVQTFRDGVHLPHKEPPVFNLGLDRADAFSRSASLELVERLLKTLAVAQLVQKKYDAGFWPAALWCNMAPRSEKARETMAQIYQGLNLPEAAVRMRAP